MSAYRTIKGVVRRYTPEFAVLLYHFFLALFAVIRYRHPSRHLTVIGVTGTKGKTTAVTLIYRTLSKAGASVGLLSTVETRIGDAARKNTKHMTMSGRGYVQKMLRDMVSAGCSYAVIEVPSEGIRQFRDFGVLYDSVVFTNLSPEHLVTHKTPERYRKTKGILFRRFARGRKKVLNGKPVRRFSLINADDAHAGYFRTLSESKTGKTVLFGLGPNAEVRAVYSPDTGRFSLEDTEYPSPFPGDISVYNAVPAVFFAREYLNAPEEVIAEALSSISGIPGRMERIDTGQPFALFCDYAHEPLSIAKACGALRRYAEDGGRVILMTGGIGGSRWKYNAGDIGETAVRCADITVFTIIDPYADDPRDILNALAEGAKRGKGGEWHAEQDRRKAIRMTLSLARAGDVVIIAGKGNEVTMETPAGSVPWDERAIIREEAGKMLARDGDA